MKIAMGDLAERTTLVVGASRGLGRGIATAFAEAGAPVIAVARSAPALADLASAPGAGDIRPEVADAGEAAIPGVLIDRHQPDVIILAAGATPLMRPLHRQTWETFSANWNADVRIAFNWLREALLRPLRPGSRVIVISSGAAVNGSPLSGGYAGAKATQRLITGYAQEEARRADLDITFTAVLPQLTPATDLGLAAVTAYAERSGRTVEQHVRQLADPLTPRIAGMALVDLALADARTLAPAYLLTGAGLRQLP